MAASPSYRIRPASDEALRPSSDEGAQSDEARRSASDEAMGADETPHRASDEGACSEGAPRSGSVAWRIHRERLMLLSWGRAILLQFAYPLVAAGVAQHSQFGLSPADNRARLHRTVHAMLDLTFGAEERAAGAAARIDSIHGRIVGRLAEPTGAHPGGAAYAARMPELLRWVYATMLDSSLLVYQRFIGPLTSAEQDQYCRESRAIGPRLGLPAALIPASRRELDAYMAEMLTSGQVAVGPTARGLARGLLQARPAALVRGPLLTALHLPTVGLLPSPLRDAYGLAWSPAQELALSALAAACRLSLPGVPSLLRDWPIARAALRADRPPRRPTPWRAWAGE